MSEPLYNFHIAEKDVGFLHGFPLYRLEKVYVKAGEPYIVHVNSSHVLTIINHEDRWGYEHLYAVHTSVAGGGHGVYADNDEEALDIFADHCAEQVPDPDNEGQTKMRWPGLVQTSTEIIEEVGEAAFEDYSGDYPGPYGNESWYFTDHSSGAMTEDVHDPKIPPIPDDLFPYTYEVESDLPRNDAIELAYWYLRQTIRTRHGDQEWAGFLEDYIYDNRETKFLSTVVVSEDPYLNKVIILVAE